MTGERKSESEFFPCKEGKGGNVKNVNNFSHVFVTNDDRKNSRRNTLSDKDLFTRYKFPTKDYN